MDWEKASAELSKKLNPDHVKGRTQGGGQVQYIEGWLAISEMNRIFGFGEWTRETLELRQLGEPREVNGKMRVDYMARVRVNVGNVVRDGSGFGQGIDKDVGQAHESALKEAETDAMKRAMMTFGNPFGLALYDKSRENVGRDEPPVTDRITKKINDLQNHHDLVAFWANGAVVKALEAMTEAEKKVCNDAYLARYEALKPAETPEHEYQ